MTSSEFSSDKWGKVSAEEDRELLIKVLSALWVNIFSQATVSKVKNKCLLWNEQLIK